VSRRTFRPNSEPQARFFASRALEILLSSGFGKGKSRVLCEKADLLCRLFPRNLVVLARKTLASMWATTLRVLLEEVIDEEHRAWGWKAHAPGGATLLYPNGSELLCVGLDNPGRALSAAFGGAFIDQAEECTEEEAGEPGLMGRLRLNRVPFRQWGAAVNPGPPTHWICKRFRPDLVSAGGHREFRTREPITLPGGSTIPAGYLLRQTFVSGKADNYSNLPTDYKIRLANMRGRYRLRFVDGLWVAFEGQIYDNWLEELHVVDRPANWPGGFPPLSWPRYRSIDFGFEHPFVCQWWARDPGGAYWLYREIYQTHRSIDEHAEQIRELQREEVRALRAEEYRAQSADTASEVQAINRRLRRLDFELSVADHDRGEREFLEKHGISTDPAEKRDVTAGIQTVYALLQPDANGLPRLRFVRDARVEPDPFLEENQKPTSTVEAMPGYRWKMPSREGVGTKEEPIKVDDDGPDAVRMLFESLRVSEMLY